MRQTAGNPAVFFFLFPPFDLLAIVIILCINAQDSGYPMGIKAHATCRSHTLTPQHGETWIVDALVDFLLNKLSVG